MSFPGTLRILYGTRFPVVKLLSGPGILPGMIRDAAQYTVDAVHYLPILTTVASAVFAWTLWRHRNINRAQGRRSAHISWWFTGVVCYGLGTLLESIITLQGNSVLLNKLWYIAGALLGGYPLAVGTAYLLLRPRRAWWIATAMTAFAGVVGILVLLSPADAAAMLPHKPGGAVLGWQKVRYATPLLNGMAALLLVGGAVLSAVRYLRVPHLRHRAWGNAAIAVGGLLPGIGGGMAKGGIVEALYIGEFVGLLFIWWGYRLCIGQPSR